MPSDSDTAAILLARAKADRSAVGELLQYYLPYLMVVARQAIDPRVIRRTSEADIVQGVLAEAARHFGEFRGATEPEFSAWMQIILSRLLDDTVRVHVLAEKRSVMRERSLCRQDGSASFYWFDLPGPDSTPSKRLVRGERALKLAQLVESLPEKQARAIHFRFLEGMKVRQIAESMGLTPVAVAGLLKRGLRTLRGVMHEESWFSHALRAPK
jgi:RNA polymerase sigma-70 factor (ECF subfamily)